MHYLGIFHSERWKIRHRPVLAMHCLVWCLSCVNLTKMYGYCWGFVSYGLILVFGLQPKFGDVKNSTSWCQATSLRPGEGSQPTVNICLTSFVFWSTHRWKDQAEEKLVLPSCKPATSKLLMLIDLRNQAIWSKHHKIKESECQVSLSITTSYTTFPCFAYGFLRVLWTTLICSKMIILCSCWCRHPR